MYFFALPQNLWVQSPVNLFSPLTRLPPRPPSPQGPQTRGSVFQPLSPGMIATPLDSPARSVGRSRLEEQNMTGGQEEQDRK